MKPSSLKKVFGIISYFPNNDSAYHIETRRERTRRCSELLFKLEELWPDIDIIIIAQNWQDYHEPEIKNKIIKYDYDKLGILGARKELRKRFLESDYDYLIMLDDDGMIKCDDPSMYLAEIDNHPDGIGVIRHVGCPLMLLAISRTIYSQIDMPDLDAEKGQGFEDDLFVAQCFNRFPDKAFDFPKDCVIETSFKYTGEGACPSSWAKEKNYDWNYMRRLSEALIKSTVRTKSSDTSESDIDVVIPYVDARDSKWMLDYTKTTGIYSPTPVRFRSWGTLKYLFRSIAKNMPFVRRIVLILARESQLPDWVNQENVKVVYHKDFIPSQYLPTFNSCTIESFLYNISDLSEQFIYFNDDMFVINMMSKTDFFTDGKPHIKFIFSDSYQKSSMFRVQCRAGLDMITNALHRDKYPLGKLFNPEHTAAPMRKSTIQSVGELCKIPINNSISALRMPKNVNQYIYAYYEYYAGDYIDDLCAYLYLEISDNLTSIRNVMHTSEIQIVCLNDSDKIKDYKKTKSQLINLLEEKFPDKSKYEI